MRAFDKMNFSKGLVLDVGCRNKASESDLVNRGFSWVGCDKVSSEGVLTCDMCDLSNAFHYKFDLIFVCHALEHCENPSQALREMKTITQSGGIIFISTPRYCYKQLFSLDKDHISVFTDLQLKKLFEYVGIDLVSQWIEVNNGVDVDMDSLITVGLIK